MSIPLDSGVTKRYNLGPVKPWVEAAANILGPMFGIKTIGGWRKYDPFPDHPSGHALDFMTPDKATGDRLVDYATQNSQQLGIKYIIWYRQYWEPGKGWVPYTSTSNPHTDHVHITFLDHPGNGTPAAGPSGGSGGTPTTPISIVDDTCAWNVDIPSVAGIGGGPMCIFHKTTVRQMVGGSLVVGGAIVALIGVALLVAYGLTNTKTGSAALSLIPYGSSVKKLGGL